jgi:hypothetical protein
MADKNFEQRVSEQMDDFKVTPSAPVWQHIEAQLRKDKRRRWFFFLLTASILVATGTGLYFSKQQQQTASTVMAENKNEAPVLSVTQKPVEEIKNKTVVLPGADKKESSTMTKEEKPVIADVSSNQKLPAPSISKQKTNSQPETDQVVSKQTAIAPANQSSKNTVAVNKKETKQAAVVPGTAPAYYPQQPTAVVNQTAVDSNIAIQSNTNSQTPNLTVVDSSSASTSKEQLANSTPVILKIDTSVATSPSTKSETKKRKWQTGFQVNAGLADVKETLFPGGEYKSLQADAFTQGNPAGMPGAFAGVTIKEYTVKSSANISLGFVMRKQIFKQSRFATGVQYQFNRFVVNNRIRRDTFSVIQNRLENAFTNETKQSFSLHYIQIPTEIQWHIAKTTKGNLMLGTGLQHHFRFAGTSVTPLFADSSSKANFYQPLLQLTPAYEWKTKTGVMQVGWYFNYGLLPVYQNADKNHWWQTGLRLQYFFQQKK